MAGSLGQRTYFPNRGERDREPEEAREAMETGGSSRRSVCLSKFFLAARAKKTQLDFASAKKEIQLGRRTNFRDQDLRSSRELSPNQTPSV